MSAKRDLLAVHTLEARGRCKGRDVSQIQALEVPQEAFKSFVRARDYCSTPSHISATCLNAIRVSVEVQNFTNVACYVAKAEQTPDVKVHPLSPVCPLWWKCRHRQILILRSA